jgi:peptide/nickel transport system ATP-binding protein
MTLDIRGLRLDYRLPGGLSVRALDGVDLTIADGEIVGLVGESGCGKTTLAYSVLRILPDNASIVEGKILYRNRDLVGLSEGRMRNIRWSKIAMVFQSSMNAFSPVHRIVDQLAAVYTAHTGSEKQVASKAAERALVRMGIPASRTKSYPHEFSGGMRQRAAIALALLLDPEVLIADEPTTALDVVVQDRILKIIQDWQRENGRSVVFVSHDIAVVAEVCDRIAVMYAGLVAELADKTDLLKDPHHPYTQALLECVPQVKGRESRLLSLSGSPPDLRYRYEGCLFQPRCAKAFADCESVSPEMYPVGDRHLARCLLYRGEGS